MKIAYYIQGFPYFTHTFIHHRIVELLRQGHAVEIFSSFDPARGKLNSVVNQHSLLERTTYLTELQPWIRRITAAQSFDAIADLFIEDVPEGATHHIERIAQFDLIHAPFANNSASVAMWLAAHARRPFSFEAHAFDLFVDFRLAQAKIDRSCKILTVCEYNRKYLLDNFVVAPDKLEIVPVSPVVSTAEHAVREAHKIISICRLHPIKDLKSAIQAVAKVIHHQPATQYEIIGEGEEREALENLAHELGIADQVTFLGELPSNEVLKRLASSAIFLHPSTIGVDGDRDAVPTAILEAMALGVPVVTTASGGIPEIIEHERSGMIVDPGNVSALAECLDRLFQEPQLVKGCVEGARLVIEARTLESTTQRMVDLLSLGIM